MNRKFFKSILMLLLLFSQVNLARGDQNQSSDSEIGRNLIQNPDNSHYYASIEYSGTASSAKADAIYR